METPGRPPVIGIIGGSGFYEIPGLEKQRWKAVQSPFGGVSDELLFGELQGQPLVFLPRHGRGHAVSPSDLNYRANIDAMKRSGVTEILSLSAVGSLSEDLPPGSFVIVEQFIDRTFARAKSFFGEGLVAHVSMAEPVCLRLGDHLAAAADEIGIACQRGGTYLTIEGPQFSTKAESRLYRTWGADVIGMTNMPEAKLAREAEICYATLAMVTDWDCWHPAEEEVSVAQILRTLEDNAARARELVAGFVPRLSDRKGPCAAGCHRALDHAIITAPERRDRKMVAKLDAIAGRVLR